MKISIGIPFYNAEEFLSDAIKSVLMQSFKEWELILLDDGSTDSSLNIAKYYAKIDGRIRVISDGMNKRLPYRLNQLIKLSKYDYIARMDADDLIHPDRLKIQLEFLENNKEYDLVSTSLVSINKKNQVKGIRALDFIYTDFSQVKRHYPIVHASILVRKKWYERNQYNINLPRSEDFELWCRAIVNNDLRMAVLPDPLYYYREEGLITAEKLKKSYTDGLEVYKSYSNNPQLKVIWGAKFRLVLVYILDLVGLLQYMVKLRNKKSPDENLVNYHEKIISRIVSKKL